MENKDKEKKDGQTVLLIILLFSFLCAVLVLRAAQNSKDDAQIARAILESKRSMATAESGLEDVAYRIRQNKPYSEATSTPLGGYRAFNTISDNFGVKTITSSSTVNNAFRAKSLDLFRSEGYSFAYGVHVGDGGLTMNNSSYVAGNIYSNGPITAGSKNDIGGTAVSAGAGGIVNNIHATGTSGIVRAHKITNSTVDSDAYYETILNTTVGGTKYPNSPDTPPIDFPISDDKITEWENKAAAGQNITCPLGIEGTYVISDIATLGPAMINCNMKVGNGATLTLTGPIWVKGSLIFGSSVVVISQSVGNDSVAMIADKTTDPDPNGRSNSSKITSSSSGGVFIGNGPNSAVFLISANNSAEDGGDDIAINLNNQIGGAVALYTNHGLIEMSQTSRAEMLIGYKINTYNSAVIAHNKGLISVYFATGPGGSWTFERYKEVVQ